MITFKNFLVENHKSHRSENIAKLVLQKVIDMVDDGHVDYSNEKVCINVGRLIKDKSLADLRIVIRLGEPLRVRFGEHKQSGDFAVVIDVSKIPSRDEIDDLLSHANYFDEIVRNISLYLSNHFSTDKDFEDTSYEKSSKNNSREAFEENFLKLKDEINSKIEQYKESKESLEKELGVTGSPARKESIQLALQHLRNDLIGKTSKDFVSKVLKGNEFSQTLNKEWKRKLISRLEDYFDHLNEM